MRFVLFLALSVLLQYQFQCNQSSPSIYHDQQHENSNQNGSNKTGLDIIVLGDWGGQSKAPYTTSDELSNAQVMGVVADRFDADFVLLVGDNFYQHGLWKDVHSKRFQFTFEDVFNASSLQKIPFYVIAGNHDYEGNITAQIEYSAISNRWVFPSRYYTIHATVPLRQPRSHSNSHSNRTFYTLDIIMTDTMLLAGLPLMDVEDCQRLSLNDAECDLQPTFNSRSQTNQNADLNPNSNSGLISYADYLKEYEWLRNAINASTADYLFVVGHYPIYSCAEHGPTWSMVENLKPLLINANAQLYIDGHDHTLEYLQESELYPNLGYVVSGSGHSCTNSTSHLDRIPAGSLKYHTCKNGGFARIHVEEDVQVFYYLGDSIAGDFDWKTQPIKPRQI